MSYRIEVQDGEGFSLGESHEETRKAADTLARDRSREREYVQAGAKRVKVFNASGVCVTDLPVSVATLGKLETDTGEAVTVRVLSDGTLAV